MLHDKNLKEIVQSTEKCPFHPTERRALFHTLVTYTLVFLAFYRATEYLFFSMLTNTPRCRILESSGPCN